MALDLGSRRGASGHGVLVAGRRRPHARLAGAGLTALLLLGLGIGIGRATAPSAIPPEAPAPGSASATSPGPSRLAAGVPVGYARSRAGAVAAAANYTAVLGGKANLDPAYGEEAYAAFALPAAREDLLRRSREFAASVPDAARLAADPALALRAVPLGYRVDRYGRDEATVSVWYAAVGVGTPELPMATAWATDRLRLRWVDGDWKVAGFTGEAGPEPPAHPVLADPDLAARINGFDSFAYFPGLAP